MKYYIFLSTLSKENKWSPYKKIGCVNDIKSARNIYRTESELRKLYDDYYADKFDIIIGRLNKLEENKVHKEALRLEKEHIDYNINDIIYEHSTVCSPYK